MMQRLKKGNISFIREFVQDGITFHWFVAMNSGFVSDCRDYINYDKEGLSYIARYDADRLPKAVQSFIQEHERVFECNVYGVKQYLYK